jgi:hypothetical protein
MRAKIASALRQAILVAQEFRGKNTSALGTIAITSPVFDWLVRIKCLMGATVVAPAGHRRPALRWRKVSMFHVQP